MSCAPQKLHPRWLRRGVCVIEAVCPAEITSSLATSAPLDNRGGIRDGVHQEFRGSAILVRDLNEAGLDCNARSTPSGVFADALRREG